MRAPLRFSVLISSFIALAVGASPALSQPKGAGVTVDIPF